MSVRHKVATNAGNIHKYIVKGSEITINNIYKPSLNAWPPQALQVLEQPGRYVGYFNSLHELWKYGTSDKNREDLVE